MRHYQLYLLTDGNISTRLEFFADEDVEALESAALLFEACSDACSNYELWSGSELLARDHPVPSPIALEMFSQARQNQMLHLEEILHGSQWLIAKSNRLAEVIDNACVDRAPMENQPELGAEQERRRAPRGNE